ncbi:hypothetical protein H3Z28_002174 [Salmonella enterica subsp. enterica serovar Ank]|nr:hypothetical protein [Salmonella enterica subsp. enterica serovar Ank]EHY9925861.1 hypothetical protein [Salmonella enterica subsp. enterica serovar Ank]
MTDDLKNIFMRMFRSGMHPQYVNLCLEMPQPKFLSMLLEGASCVKKERVTRAELAKINGISERHIYSYFSSDDARDYRPISSDKRIAMIWRTIAGLKRDDRKFGKTRGDMFYLINGEKYSLSESTKILGYANPSGLYHALKRRGIQYGDEISHMSNNANTKAKLYIVNGVKMSISKAARILGYSSSPGLSTRLKKYGVQPGSDISGYTKKRKSKAPLAENETNKK